MVRSDFCVVGGVLIMEGFCRLWWEYEFYCVIDSKGILGDFNNEVKCIECGGRLYYLLVMGFG